MTEEQIKDKAEGIEKDILDFFLRENPGPFFSNRQKLILTKKFARILPQLVVAIQQDAEFERHKEYVERNKATQ